ncbi:MAG: phage major capsid protein [Akkermansiaceae bacterium]|nr:phage major capsid protein [Akkermansiaceae bacterium]
MKLKEMQELRGSLMKQAREILDLAATEKRALSADEQTKLAQMETDIDGYSATIDAEVRQIQREAQSQSAPTLSEGENRDLDKFDLSKLINHLHRSAKGSTSRSLDGIEAELIQEGEREARDAGIESSGILLPRAFVRRENRDLTATGTTSTAGDQGGMTIATEKRGLLDDFFNASVMRQAGATVLEGLKGNLDLPRIIAGTDPTKKAENAASDEVSPTTAMLSLSPKRLPAHIDVSERLLMQSSVALEAVLRGHLTTQMGAIQEKAFFHGGGTNEATGIAGTAGIGSVAGGTNGAAPSLAKIVELETAVDTTNALLGNLHYVTNGQIRGKLKTTPKVASTDSVMLLGDSAGSQLNGYTPLFTNAVSRTLTKGSESGTASAIFFGNFSDYVIGYWGGVSLEMVRDKTNAISGLYTLVASAYYDGGVVRPKSFAAQLDALGA